MKALFVFCLFFLTTNIFASPSPPPSPVSPQTSAITPSSTQPAERKRGCRIERTSLALTEETTDVSDTFTMNLTPLRPGKSYRITCGIEAQADLSVYLSLSENTSQRDREIVVFNGQRLEGNLNEGMTLQVKKGQNALEMWYVKQVTTTQSVPVHLTFLNQHPKTSATVHSCGAKLVLPRQR
ncbi:MAG: hypothetical protein K0Q74_650 [Gammaproteobacteria bacterium]|jgi:hypothetical protein|nr:hypothetical protein [Gammaproteobacteria bacterium]